MTLALVQSTPERNPLETFYEMKRRLAPALQAMVEIEAKIRGLSERELEVLNLLLDGLEYAEAAKKLGVSVHTVKNQANSICRKFGVSRREGIVAQIWRRF